MNAFFFVLMIDGVLVIYSNPEEGGTGDSGEGEGGFEGL